MNINRNKVAKLAGVSPVTVSRVFRNSALVASETKQKVLEAGRECGYFPNAAARAIRKGRFNRIAAVVVQYGAKGTCYFPNNGFLDPVVNELAEHGYSVILEPMYLNLMNDEFFEPPRLFGELAVDGILGLPTGGIVPSKVDKHIAQLGAPTVWMNRNPEQHSHCVVGDEEANGRRLTRHLIELGHQRVGYITFESPNYQLQQRYRGIIKELQVAGLETSHVLVGPRAACMVDLSEQLLNQNPRPTAIMCFHRGAYDAMSHTALRYGIKVPEELSICYFASPWQVMQSDYRPTALELAESQIAVTAVRRLLDLIESRNCNDAIKPIAGVLRPGWTTASPGKAWTQGVEHCEHDQSKCMYLERMEHWKNCNANSQI